MVFTSALKVYVASVYVGAVLASLILVLSLLLMSEFDSYDHFHAFYQLL